MYNIKLTLILLVVIVILLVVNMLPKNDSIIYHKQDLEGVANYGFELEENECLYVNGDDYTDFFITECVKGD